MDYPLTKAAAYGLVGGKFTNGVPGVSEPSVIPAETSNAVIDELLAVLAAGGVAKNEAVFTQLATAIQNMIEARVGDYALATGLVNAYVVALVPAVVANSKGLEVKFKVPIANTGNCTLDGGGGPVALVRNDGVALVPGDLPLNALISATCDGPAGPWIINSIVVSQALTQGAADARYAALAGLLTQIFRVANAVGVNDAVPLGQADARFAKLAGLATQQFNAANGTLANHAVTLGQFLSTLGMSGKITLPGGVIIQWGRCTPNSAGIATTYSTSFPNANYVVLLTNNGGADNRLWTDAAYGTLSGFTAFALSSVQASYIAIGS